MTSPGGRGRFVVLVPSKQETGTGCPLCGTNVSLQGFTGHAFGSDSVQVFGNPSPIDAPCGTPHLFVISSYWINGNTRPLGLDLTVGYLFRLYRSDLLAQSTKGVREGPLSLYQRVNSTGRFRPGGSWWGQRSSVRACFHDAGPASNAKTLMRRNAVRLTRRLRRAFGRCSMQVVSR